LGRKKSVDLFLNHLIGKTLYDFRTDADYTQEQAASLLNVSRLSYLRYERGNQTLPVPVLMDFIDKLSITPTRFFNHLQRVKLKGVLKHEILLEI